MIRALVVDDHPLVLAAVCATLGAADGIEVIRACSDPVEAVAAAEILEPDVVVMDINMPGLSGFEAARLIRGRGLAVRILIMTGTRNADGPATAESVGATGYVLKGDPALLVDAVRAVADGGTAWPLGFAAPVDRGGASSHNPPSRAAARRLRVSRTG